MKEFLDYDIKYPDLVLDIVNYFSLGNGIPKQKSVQGFVTSYKVPKGENPIQPEIVGRICERLCECRRMSCLSRGSIMSFNDNYLCTGIAQEKLVHFRSFYRTLYNSIIYGFEYIYKNSLPNVLPLIAYTDEGESMGTCFRMFNGLITAKHCLTDGKKVAVKGYNADFLNKCKVYVSKNPDIDLAYIETNETAKFNIAQGHVLEDVLVMGYPKVSFFLNFCTGEKATISSQAELRMTPTVGAIAAQGEIYYPKGLPSVYLVTAKIRGGNSGGPVINKEGMVVAVATGISAGEGLSDDNIGYGMAYPIQCVETMMSEKNYETCTFVEFLD